MRARSGLDSVEQIEWPRPSLSLEELARPRRRANRRVQRPGARALGGVAR